MYEQFYGLSALPFSLLPDADFMFLSKRHRRAINLLEYGMLAHAGFIVITGEVGAGKTTVVRRFVKNAPKDAVLGVISNPSRTLGSLLNWIAKAFNLQGDTQDSAKAYHEFVDFLVGRYAEGKRTVLIIDEAQNLGSDMLEELRMLSNVNNEKDQLLQIVLTGQPELLEMLQRPELRQFAQRISVHCHLDALTPAETAAYIRHRLEHARGKADIFDGSACACVHYFSGGVPRLINLLCDQAMVYGFSEDKHSIGGGIIREVVMDRAKSGLNVFRALPEGWESAELPEVITRIEREMAASRGAES